MINITHRWLQPMPKFFFVISCDEKTVFIARQELAAVVLNVYVVDPTVMSASGDCSRDVAPDYLVQRPVREVGLGVTEPLRADSAVFMNARGNLWWMVYFL
jgi:hypothetical protein